MKNGVTISWLLIVTMWLFAWIKTGDISYAILAHVAIVCTYMCIIMNTLDKRK